MPKKPAVVITRPKDDSPPVEVIAEAIVKMAEGMKVLNGSRLKRETVVALIADNSHVAKTTIRIVLNNLDDLEATWLKPKPSRK